MRAAMGPDVCTTCGRPMVKGYLVAEAFVDGAKWMTEKSRLARGGEILIKPDGWGNVYMDAYRCTGCRRVIVQY